MNKLFKSLLVAAAVAMAGCGINSIPIKDEAVNAAWGEVQNAYQRRADLIPNLVEVVKGYATHEKETLTQVIEARAKATQTVMPENILKDPEAMKRYEAQQGQLGAVLGRLMMLKERYPDLKADRRFAELQSQVEGTENRIAVARRTFIKATQDYNTEIRVPARGLVWATISGAQPKPQFSAEESAKTAPKISFK